MPVWQKFHASNQNRNVEVLSVAIDVQGRDKITPYTTKAQTNFVTLIDQTNLLGELYGFKAIPNGFLIDEHGIMRYKKLGGFDIRNHDTYKLLDNWITTPNPVETLNQTDQELGTKHEKSNELFRNGVQKYKHGDLKGALKYWRKGTKIDPSNYIIRKQIWAIENPENFYEGDVNYSWQQEQIRKNR